MVDETEGTDAHPDTENPDAATEPTESATTEAKATAGTGATDLAERVARYNAETVRLCQEAEVEATEAEDEYNLAHQHAKELKQVLDRKQAELRRLIRERVSGRSELERGQTLLPFGAEPADAWRSVPITDLGLADGIVSLLMEAAIPSLGCLADWTKEKDLDEIPGIGGVKADAIRDALERFWARYPEVPDVEPAADAPPTETETKDALDAALGIEKPTRRKKQGA